VTEDAGTGAGGSGAPDDPGRAVAETPRGARWFASDLLAGRRALVTGGGTGLGLAMAETFAALGASVAICGRRQEVLEAAAERIGPGTRRHACDLRDRDAVEAMLDALWEDGPLDVLVNNAAANFVARSETLSSRAVDAILDISLKAAAGITLSAGRRWLAAGAPATVLSIVTSYAWHGSPFVVPSAMAKAGLLAMTRSLASEWGPRGIRLNALAPGTFPTKGAFERLVPRPEMARGHETNNAMGRPGDPQEFAALAAFLVSDASAYVQGECVTLDGGRWPHMAGTFGFLHGLTAEEWEAMAPRKGGS
jgi:NAD(P)-dependent dehydrogenase (short-subunit alcohol dehydrogenase family)